MRNVSNCDVCERRGPGCPCVGVSAVTDPVQPIIGLYISTWRERMATLGQCTEVRARGGVSVWRGGHSGKAKGHVGGSGVS